MATSKVAYVPGKTSSTLGMPPLRLWLDTEHRRIAEALRGMLHGDADETITGNWTFAAPVVVDTDNSSPLSILGDTNGSYTALIDNDSNGTANSSRWAASSGDSNVALFVAGSGRTSTVLTGGPTGAQAVLRTLGSYPLILGTNNNARVTIASDGVATFAVAGATFETSLIISGDSIAGLTLVDEDGGTDEKATHLRQNGGVTNFYFTDDDTPTSVTGANIALQLTRSGKTPLTVRLPQDNHELRFGASGDDLAIYHDGTDNRIDSNTGSLIITGNLSVTGTIAGIDVDDSVRQTSDLVITSNAAYQDTGISVALTPGEYIVTGVTMFSVNAAPDGRLRLNFTGTTSYTRGARYSFSDTSATLGGATVSALPSETAILTLTDEYCHHWIQHIVVTGSGTLSIQAKQNTSSLTSVTFRRGSFLRVVRVS